MAMSVTPRHFPNTLRQTAVARIRLCVYNRPYEQSKANNLHCNSDLRPASGLRISHRGDLPAANFGHSGAHAEGLGYSVAYTADLTYSAAHNVDADRHADCHP